MHHILRLFCLTSILGYQYSVTVCTEYFSTLNKFYNIFVLVVDIYSLEVYAIVGGLNMFFHGE